MWQQTGRCLHIIMLMRSPSYWKKAKRTKRKQRSLKTLTPSGHGYRQSKLLSEAAVFRWGQVLRSGWHGGWLGSAWLAALTSHRLALQRHYHVPAQLLSQRCAVLDVIQPVHLPLVFDTWGHRPEVTEGSGRHTPEQLRTPEFDQSENTQRTSWQMFNVCHRG